ncbi:hypothetical protein [Emticicia sp. C21]|uniref:hypothetical protein n=1 Tax=Emticicia sp. C21 TaxID=2302915 RepID=UPI000E34A02D|nr:hypothetical protein [Emticicia sp. C21]RFS16848.1 hypothetical protein D0T08_09210 [Emticicia sp. C21]
MNASRIFLTLVLVLFTQMAFSLPQILDLNKNDSIAINPANGTFNLTCRNFNKNNFDELRFFTEDGISTKISAQDVGTLSNGNTDFTIEIRDNRIIVLNKFIRNPIASVRVLTKDLNPVVVVPPAPAAKINLSGFPLNDAIIISKVGLAEYREELISNYGNDVLGNSWLASVNIKKAADSKSTQPGATSSSAIDAKALDALARLIATRFKQELTIAYLNKFKKFIEDKTAHYSVDALLPLTYEMLLQIDKDGVAFNSYLPTLRDAFHQDFQALPENSITFLTSLQQKGRLAGVNDNLYVGSLASLHIFKEFYRKKKPVQVLGAFDKPDYLIKSPDNDVRRALFSLSILSRSLQTNETEWVGKTDALAAIKDENVFKLFMGLMMEKEKQELVNIQYTGINLYTRLENLAGSADKIAETQKQIGVLINNFSELITEIKSLKSETDKAKMESFSTVYSIVNHTINSTAVALDILNIWGVASAGSNNFRKDILPIAKASANLVKAVYDKEYGTALSHGLFIYGKLDASTCAEADENSACKTRKKILDYGMFMYNVVTAENSADLEKVLDAVILPVGSYAVKRNSNFNVSLNAYGGAFLGWETISISENNKPIRKQRGTIAPSAPIGIYFGWGGKVKQQLTGHSFGIFVPVIDLGSPFAFRLKDSETETLPEFNLNNVIAPGIFFSWGIKKSPLSVAFGAQKSPELRGFKDEKADLGYLNAWRFGFKIAVDIPLFNIITR